MNDDTPIILEILDQRPRVVPRSLKDPHTLLNSGTSVPSVVWRIDAGEEGKVDAERL
jgi:hypothetical protein